MPPTKQEIPKGFQPTLCEDLSEGDTVYLAGRYLKYGGTAPCLFGPYRFINKTTGGNALLEDLEGKELEAKEEELLLKTPTAPDIWRDSDGGLHTEKQHAGKEGTLLHPDDILEGKTEAHFFQSKEDAEGFVKIWNEIQTHGPEKSESYWVVILVFPSEETGRTPECILHRKPLAQGGGFIVESHNGSITIYGEPDPNDSSLDDALEHLIGNSELEWINPADTGDLTDAPMLGILGEPQPSKIGPHGSTLAGCWGNPLEAHYYPIQKRWAYMSYEVKDPLEELKEKGRINLVGE